MDQTGENVKKNFKKKFKYVEVKEDETYPAFQLLFNDTIKPYAQRYYDQLEMAVTVQTNKLCGRQISFTDCTGHLKKKEWVSVEGKCIKTVVYWDDTPIVEVIMEDNYFFLKELPLNIITS